MYDVVQNIYGVAHLDALDDLEPYRSNIQGKISFHFLLRKL